MQYAKRPEGMDDADWDIECQCRMVAREMKTCRDRADRGQIFEQWKVIVPGITRERVAAIWKEGVPMPADKVDRVNKGAA